MKLQIFVPSATRHLVKHMDENKQLEITNIVKEAIEDRLKREFNTGVVAGWEACISTIYKNTRNMTSAKKIKDYIKQKYQENIKPEF